MESCPPDTHCIVEVIHLFYAPWVKLYLFPLLFVYGISVILLEPSVNRSNPRHGAEGKEASLAITTPHSIPICFSIFITLGISKNCMYFIIYLILDGFRILSTLSNWDLSIGGENLGCVSVLVGNGACLDDFAPQTEKGHTLVFIQSLARPKV